MAEKRKISDIGLIYMLSNVGLTAAVFFLPLLLEERGLTDLQIAILAMPYSIALFLSNSISGRLTDSYGRRPFLLTGLVISAISTAFYVLPQNFSLFFFARIFNGISMGMFPAAIVAIASDRKTSMGNITSWRAAGWAIGAVSNGILAEVLRLEAAFILGALLFSVAFFYAIYKDTGGRADTIQQRSLQEEGVSPNYTAVLKQNWQVYLAVIIRHSSGGSIWVYWTLFLKFDLGLNQFQIGIVLAINTIVQTFVMRIFGDRGDPQKMFLAGILLSALSFFSFPLTRNFLEISLTQILLGISFSFFLVGGLRSAEERGSQLNMVGTATGLFEASFSISQMIGPVIAILVFAQYQTYTSLMYFAGIVTTCGAIFYGIISTQKPLAVDENTTESTNF